MLYLDYKKFICFKIILLFLFCSNFSSNILANESCLSPHSMLSEDKPDLGDTFWKTLKSLDILEITDPLDGTRMNGKTIEEWFLERPSLAFKLYNIFKDSPYPKDSGEQRYYREQYRTSINNGIKKIREQIRSYATKYLNKKEMDEVISQIDKKTGLNRQAFKIGSKHQKMLVASSPWGKKKNLPITDEDKAIVAFLKKQIYEAVNVEFDARFRRYNRSDDILSLSFWDIPIWAVNEKDEIIREAMQWIKKSKEEPSKDWEEKLRKGQNQVHMKSLAEITGLKEPPKNSLIAPFRTKVKRVKSQNHLWTKTVKHGADTKTVWVLIRNGIENELDSLWDVRRSIDHEIQVLLLDLRLVLEISKSISDDILGSILKRDSPQLSLFLDLGDQQLESLKQKVISLKEKLGKTRNTNWSEEKKSAWDSLSKCEELISGKTKFDFNVIKKPLQDALSHLAEREKNIRNIIPGIKNGRMKALKDELQRRDKDIMEAIKKIDLKVKDEKVDSAIIKAMKLAKSFEIKNEPEYWRFISLLFGLKYTLQQKAPLKDILSKTGILKQKVKASAWVHGVLNIIRERVILNSLSNSGKVDISQIRREAFMENLKQLDLLKPELKFERCRGWARLVLATEISRNSPVFEAASFLIWLMEIKQLTNMPWTQIGKVKRKRTYELLKEFMQDKSSIEITDISPLMESISEDHELNTEEKKDFEKLLWDESIVQLNAIKPSPDLDMKSAA